MTPTDYTASLLDQFALETEHRADTLAESAANEDALAATFDAPSPERTAHREVAHQLRQAAAATALSALHLRRGAQYAADEYDRAHQPF